MSLIREVRLTVRSLAKRPAFAGIAIATLALGIGANTAIYSVLNALMFKPLPVEKPHQLVSITLGSGSDAFPRTVSYPDYRDFMRLDGPFSGVVANFTNTSAATIGDRAEKVLLSVVTSNYFTVLGVEAGAGRLFGVEQEEASAEPVAVISHQLWLHRFGGDEEVVGTTILLRGQPVTIAGVTPPDFHGSNLLMLPDFFVPVSTWSRMVTDPVSFLENRSAAAWRIIARLRSDVTREQAEAAVETRMAQLGEEYPTVHKGVRAFVHPEPLTRLEPGAAIFMPIVAGIFMTLVGLVLLVACANVSNLLLVRVSGRQRELAVRTALGAGRLTLLRSLVLEGVLLALAGAAAGLALAHWATGLIEAIQIPTIPFFIEFPIDYSVFTFALAAALVTGILAAALPGLQASRLNLIEALRSAGRASGGRVRQRVRSALVVTQVAISLALLIGTGLFVQSLFNVEHMDLGFASENRLLVTVDASLNSYPRARNLQLLSTVLDRVRQLPGVRSATVATTMPVGFDSRAGQIWAAGEATGDQNEQLFSMFNAVGSDYFRTMEVPLVEGRTIDEVDVDEGRRVVIVNQRLAGMLWPGGRAIGRLLAMDDNSSIPLEVIGIARDGVYSIPGEPVMPYFYVPITVQSSVRQVYKLHTEGDPLSLAAAVRAEVAAVDPDLPITDLRSGISHLRDGKATLLFKLGSSIIGAFGLIAFLLATFGLYGMIANSVQQRQQELGVRMALGARPADILGLIVRQGVGLAIGGLILGVPLAVFTSGLFEGFLVGVTSTDPATYLFMGVLVVLVALAASLLPARLRALAIDPVTAVRGD